MERLTVKGPSGLISLKNKSENGANQAIKCLSEYEDTDLTPEQILELKERNTAKAPEEIQDAARNIIRKHMNDGWISVERELPPNAKYKGALCPRYQLNTKYGVTEGWYNPDLESWFVLVWFMTKRYLNGEIDFENGAHPKIVRCENEVNEKHRIVLAWRPFPESYQAERGNNHDREGSNIKN